ncbi:MAG: metallopeptidase [Verrucomicrobia bacterium]|nr:metallopeptidase [Verrucomicrobiota bacterium]
MTAFRIRIIRIFSTCCLGMMILSSVSAEGFLNPVIKEVQGWKVHIDPALLVGGEQDEIGEKAIIMLANHLQRIEILMPAKILQDMKKIEIWLEYQNDRLGAMQYHPSQQWLITNRHDPRLARKVHITRASDLLSRQQMLKHPFVILHELAHAYHDQFLGFDHPDILKAFQSARDSGLYQEVLLYTGEKVRHYALTNHKEYFAEATEAYFYRNDFFPFVRAELEAYDPVMHQLLVEIWGPLE